MKKAIILAFSSFALPALGMSTAYAGGLVFVNPVKAPSANAGSSGLTEVRDASSAPVVRDGVQLSASDDLKRVLPTSDFGESIPLSFALKQVLPDDMLVHFGDGVDGSRLVSWHGGQTVEAILGQLSRENGLKYLVEGQLVSFVPKGASFRSMVQTPPTQTPAIQTQAPPVISSVSVHQDQPASPASSPVQDDGGHIAPSDLPKKTFAPADGGPGVYYAPAGEEIDAILANWASKTGWMVAYKTDMRYRLEAPVSFEGSFEQAVSGLIDSIKATPRPRAMLYRGNHVVHVYTDDDN